VLLVAEHNDVKGLGRGGNGIGKTGQRGIEEERIMEKGRKRGESFACPLLRSFHRL